MITLIWTFALLLTASIVIGWAAELTAIHLSAGIALAILAWLQTAPEFAVEATIAWSRDAHLALANLTGSLRLLMGLGWPVVFLIYFYSSRRRGQKSLSLILPKSFCVEAAALTVPILYFIYIYFKKSWSAYDGFLLCGFYGFYFWLLYQERKHSTDHSLEEAVEEDEPFLVRMITKKSKRYQITATAALFVIGGSALILSAHPFIEALKEVALKIGVSDFVFIQWIAPIASELPEKITAFTWASKPKKASMAIVNMLSSVTSQWTLLAGLVPIIFSISAGQLTSIPLDGFQRTELLLTIAQSALAVILLSDLKIEAFEAVGIFLLWLAQFFFSGSHQMIAKIYIIWFGIELLHILTTHDKFIAWNELGLLFRKIVFGNKKQNHR